MRFKVHILAFFFSSLCILSVEFDSPAHADGDPNRISCSSPGSDFSSDDGHKYYPASMTCKNDCTTVPYTDCISRTKFIFGIFRLTLFEYERTCFCTVKEALLRLTPSGMVSSVRSLTDRDRLRLLETDANGKIVAGDDDYLVVTIDRACSPQTTSIATPS